MSVLMQTQDVEAIMTPGEGILILAGEGESVKKS